jgi:hypothetical protein
MVWVPIARHLWRPHMVAIDGPGEHGQRYMTAGTASRVTWVRVRERSVPKRVLRQVGQHLTAPKASTPVSRSGPTATPGREPSTPRTGRGRRWPQGAGEQIDRRTDLEGVPAAAASGRHVQDQHRSPVRGQRPRRRRVVPDGFAGRQIVRSTPTTSRRTTTTSAIGRDLSDIELFLSSRKDGQHGDGLFALALRHIRRL